MKKNSKQSPNLILSFGFPLLVSLCILLFYPLTTNAILVKEIMWWCGLLLVMGLILVSLDINQKRLLEQSFQNLRQSLKGIFVVLLLWFVWNGFEAARSIDSFEARIALARLGGYLATFFVFALFYQNKKARTILIEFIGYACMICAVYVIAESLGLDFVPWKVKDRPPGTFANPNFTADFLASMFPLILSLDISARIPKDLSSKGTVTPAGKGFSLRTIPYRSLFVLTAILATQSRSGFIGLMAGGLCATLLFGYLFKRDKKRASPGDRSQSRWIVRLALGGVLFVEIIAGLVFWFLPEKLSHVLNATTVQVRLGLWKGAFLVFRETWERILFGWGLGSFDTASQKVIYLVEPIVGAKQAQHAHSWLVEILVEQGLLGATFFLAILFLFTRRFWKALTQSKDWEAKILLAGGLAGLAALLSSTLFDVWLNWWSGAWTLWLLLGLCAALLIVIERGESRIPDSRTLDQSLVSWEHVLKILGIVLLVLSLCFIVKGINLFRAEILTWRGTAFLQSSRNEAALEKFQKAEEVFPRSPLERFWKAVCLANLKRYDEAEKIAKALISRNPGIARFHMLMGLIASSRGKIKEAEDFTRRGYEIEPGGESALRLAKFHVSLKEFDKAKDVLEGQMKRAIYPPLLHYYLKVEKDQGRMAEARETLSRLRENLPFLKRKTRGELARWEAELSTLMGDKPRAKVSYRVSLMYDPANYQVWNDFGLVLKDLDRLEQADKAYAHAMDLEPKAFVPIFNRLELSLQRKDYALARTLIEKLRKLKMPPEAVKRLEAIEKNLPPPQ